MPIKKIKAQSPDPYLGKIKGDTELARLAHLNNIVDQINQAGIAGAYATVEENGTPLPQQNTINFTGDGVSVSDVAGKTVVNIPGGGGGSLSVNDNGPVNNLYITFNNTSVSESYDPNTNTYGITYTPEEYDPGYKVYRAKIAAETINWPGYGYLYNWFAVTDVRKLENPSGGTGLTAPNEWRVPSDTDWNTLIAFIGGYSVAGGKLKSTLNSDTYPFYGWANNGEGTDDYNFEGLPGGYRSPDGNFAGIGVNGNWWTTTTNGLHAIAFSFSTSNNSLTAVGSKIAGCSVRLVREATASELLLNDGDTSDTSSLDPYTGNDGKTYVTVKIGTQIWLAQNLRETKYNDNSDIFNAGSLIIFGGDANETTWQAKGAAQEGAWTAYLFGNTSPNFPGSGNLVEYNPTTVKLFYNDVLENTLDVPSGFPIWTASSDVNGPVYFLGRPGSWGKTHIKITPGYDVSDFPTINERSLLIERAVEPLQIEFRPIKRDNTGTITIEDLNNYPASPAVSYVYVEILEYPAAYYGSGLNVALGASNLEDEEEVVALTYEINGVTYTEDLEAKKLSIEIAKIYDQLGIFDKYKTQP